MANEYCLNQEIDLPTHAVETLDLIFTNNPDISTAVDVEDWPNFTDHRLVKALTSFSIK